MASDRIESLIAQMTVLERLCDTKIHTTYQRLRFLAANSSFFHDNNIPLMGKRV